MPAIHRNRAEIREIFLREMAAACDRRPADRRAARRSPRRPGGTCGGSSCPRQVAVSGANFAVAETGTLAVVESEGNGRMCLTLPETLITVMGIEKLVPTWRDLEVFLQLLPRSSTGERMNPYTSMWTGVTPGDGPQDVPPGAARQRAHARCSPTRSAAQALHCIRCSACLNVCPVYERTGGHAYGSVYPGPIGAVLSPQLTGGRPGQRVAAVRVSLCGACYDACPVKIDIPTMLVHLRGAGRGGQAGAHRLPTPEQALMAAAGVDDGLAAAVDRGAARRPRSAGCSAARRRPHPRAAAAAVRLDRQPGPARARRPRPSATGGRARTGRP